MQLKIKLIFLLILGFNLTRLVYAQTFGFGCLGFVSGYGGFTYQQYDAARLNNFVVGFNQSKSSSLQSSLDEFSSAGGYRVGINFFRAAFPAGFFITAKGYYQSLGKTNSTSENTGTSTVDYDFELDLKNWAVGFDVGMNIFDRLSWKIIDGAFHFNNVSLTSTENSPGVTTVTKYESDAGVLGYSIGTGVVVFLIKDYISLEGLAGYTFIQIEEMQTEDGQRFPIVYPDPIPMPTDDSSNNFIDSGGFTAVIQLNIGFPL